jgi:hypothetical protein
MEIGIPLVALAGLYLVSKSDKKETFENRKEEQLLPNTNIPDMNYPDSVQMSASELDLTNSLSHNNKYDGGAYTDKYFNQNAPNSLFNSSSSSPASNSGCPSNLMGQSFTSLAGQEVGCDYFRHNNMVPFFGSKFHSNYQDTGGATDLIMDNYLGTGTQTISKKEQSPLFKPDENLQWAYGAPNQTDFYQSRVNPSMRMANVKPFEEERVAPGIGLGYGTEGSAGFNSGMLAREMWMPKTVDELRVDSHSKAGGQMLLGHEGPANSYVKTTGTIGIVEKNRPDKMFENGQDRYLTTTGVEKGPTMRAIPVEKHVNRPDTSIEYSGGAKYMNSSMYTDGEYMESKNIQLRSLPVGIAYSEGAGGPNVADYGMKSQFAYPNNRSANQQTDYYGAVGGAIGAVVAPLLDILKPSRRQNVIGTLRPYQNASTKVALPYVFNPADRPGTTIRETTENSKFHLNIDARQNGGAYIVTENQPAITERMNQSDFYYAGNSSAGANARQPRPYDAEYRQRNNDIKSSTIDGRLIQGNMSLNSANVNMQAKAKDQYMINNRAVNPTMPAMPPSTGNMGRLQGKPGLYENIQQDRTHPDVLSQLKGNPFALNMVNGL